MVARLDGNLHNNAVVAQLDLPDALDHFLVAVPDHDLARAARVVALELGYQLSGRHRPARVADRASDVPWSHTCEGNSRERPAGGAARALASAHEDQNV